MTTGNYSPEELAAQFREMEAKVKRSRREDLASLVPEMERLAESIRVEHKLDSEALEAEKSRIRQEFSLLQRLNPFDSQRREAQRQKLEPVRREVAVDKQLLVRCCERLEWVRNASKPIEWRTRWDGGVAGVYNEATGQVEWREAWHAGVAGVYHPDERRVIWREQWKHGVAGVFNPVTREVEWKESWHGGVAGVFHPKLQEVQWRTSWHHGVCGIYNPITESVEWREAWKSGIAGAWCPQLKQVQWHDQWQHGVACVFYDGSTYHGSGSYYGDNGD